MRTVIDFQKSLDHVEVAIFVKAIDCVAIFGLDFLDVWAPSEFAHQSKGLAPYAELLG